MARFFFDTRDDDRLIEDDLGFECDSIDAVKVQATVCLAEIARDVLPGCDERVLAIEVTDSERQPILNSPEIRSHRSYLNGAPDPAPCAPRSASPGSTPHRHSAPNHPLYGPISLWQSAQCFRFGTRRLKHPTLVVGRERNGRKLLLSLSQQRLCARGERASSRA